MSKPLVSVICLCYNHRSFVRAAIQSALDQTYDHLEIIVVDDGSTDGSKTIISEILAEKPEVKFINLQHNIGNCRAFNMGFRQSKGSYIIDLATDDIMHPTRIAKQVALFEMRDRHYGVVYTDALFIDDMGKFLGQQSTKYRPVEGDVYQDIIQRYFVSPPTMMIRREVLEDLGGYDESLAYEDFDFWVRSSRKFHYGYLNEPLTTVRRVPKSKSGDFFSNPAKMAQSTLLVCRKIKELNKDQEETTKFQDRLQYELRQLAMLGLDHQAKALFQLMEPSFIRGQDRFWLFIARLRINFGGLVRWVKRAKY